MIMNEYETIFVTRPDLDAEEQARLGDKFESVISNNGTILVKEEWGKRKMAYEIQKHGYGHYTYLNFVGPADIPTEIERSVKVEDNIIRFLTVKLEDTVDVDECRVVAEERQRKRAEKRVADAESRAAAASRREDRPRREDRGPRPERSERPAAAKPAAEAKPAPEEASKAPAEDAKNAETPKPEPAAD
jgi:small subunit ribosomal protein S6